MSVSPLRGSSLPRSSRDSPRAWSRTARTPVGRARVALRPFQVGDAAAIAESCKDPEIPRFTMMPEGLTEERAREWIERGLDWWPRGVARFAVTLPPSAACAGQVGIQYDFPARRAEAFYWLDRRARGRGLASEALNLVTEWAFRDHDVVRVQLVTHLENEPSQASRKTLRLQARRRAEGVGAGQGRPTRRRDVEPTCDRSGAGSRSRLTARPSATNATGSRPSSPSVGPPRPTDRSSPRTINGRHLKTRSRSEPPVVWSMLAAGTHTVPVKLHSDVEFPCRQTDQPWGRVGELSSKRRGGPQVAGTVRASSHACHWPARSR